jgi:hypothetical protein
MVSDEVIAATEARLDPIFDRRETGEKDDWRAGVDRELPDMLAELKSIHGWQADIQEDEVEATAGQFSQGNCRLLRRVRPQHG